MTDQTVLDDPDVKPADTTSSTPAPKDDTATSTDADPKPAPDASSNDDGGEKGDPDSPQVPDWVETAGRGDDKRIARLKLWTDPGAMLDSFLSLEAKLNQRGVMLPGEKASEADLKAWNKAVGVPDDPTGYKVDLKIPDGESLDDEDKTILSSVTESLHKQGGILAHPSVINAIQQAYVDQKAEAASQMMAKATAFHEAAEAEMEKEWGAEKDRNVKFALGVIERFGEEGLTGEEGLFRKQFADGTRLGDYMPFVRLLTKIGREYGDDPIFAEISKTSGMALQTMEQRRDEIMKLRADKKFKEFDAAQGELNQLNQAIERHTKRQP